MLDEPSPRAGTERASTPATAGSERPPPAAFAAWVVLGGVTVGCLGVSFAALASGARRGDAFLGRCALVGCLFSAALVKAVWDLYRATERRA